MPSICVVLLVFSLPNIPDSTLVCLDLVRMERHILDHIQNTLLYAFLSLTLLSTPSSIDYSCNKVALSIIALLLYNIKIIILKHPPNPPFPIKRLM